MFRNTILVILLASALLACNNAPKQGSQQDAVGTTKVKVNKTISLAVDGMTCEGCENTIKESVEKVPGIVSAKASYKDKVVVIAYDSTQARVNDISQAITGVGYEVKGLKTPEDKAKKTH